MSIPTNEQETVISYGRNDKTAKIWTSDPTQMTKFDKLVADEGAPAWQLEREDTINGEVVGKAYTTDKGLVSFRKAKTTKMLTEEQRAASAKRIKEWQERQRESKEASKINSASATLT